MSTLVSIVVPFHNEEEVLPRFFKELRDVLKDVSFEYEVIAVDDGSRDKTFEILSSFADSDPALRVVKFSRNFGHQVALKAGLDFAHGDAVVTIDGDLQDPPSLIPEMVAKWKEGHDVVYAVRNRREGEPLWRKSLILLYYKVLSKISRLKVPADSGDFRLMSRRAVDQLCTVEDPMPYMRGLATWVGFPQTAVYYDRHARAAGYSKYGLLKLIQLAWNGITSLSHVPLRAATLLGAGFSMIAVLMALLVLIGDASWRWRIESWVPIVLSVIFVGGVQLLTIGILGEYIGRIYERMNKRPAYIVQDKINFFGQGDPKAVKQKGKVNQE